MYVVKIGNKSSSAKEHVEDKRIDEIRPVSVSFSEQATTRGISRTAPTNVAAPPAVFYIELDICIGIELSSMHNYILNGSHKLRFENSDLKYVFMLY